MNTSTLDFSPRVVDERSTVSRTSAGQLVVRAAQVFLAVWLCSYIVSGLRAAFWFDGFPVNGPFQLYNPLRRLAAGQHAGTDFQFFHGIGVPFLHYPLFWLFGGHSLAASELSRQFTSLLLFIGSLSFFLWAVYRRNAVHREQPTLRSPFLAAAGLIMLLEVAFPRGVEPGHSLVSGRSTMPLLAFALLELRLNRWIKALLTGFVIAAAFTFGTEHGISLTLALFGVTAISCFQALFLRRFAAAWENICFVAVSLLSAFISGAALFIGFCGLAGARRALHFNLVELPGDQFWFFGSPPMPYLTSFRQLLFDHHVLLCFLPSFVLATILLAVVATRWRAPLRIASDWSTHSVLMLTYAILTAIPLIGILSRHYVFPQTRVFLLVAVLALAHGFGRETFRRFGAKSVIGSFTVSKLGGALFVSIALLSALGLGFRSVKSAAETLHHYRQPASFDHSLDGHWNSFMTGATQVINQHRTRPQLSLWSEYAALLDAHFGSMQPAEDYIIHTVGPDRWHHYLASFRNTNPEFVTTMTSQFSFAEWLRDERWEFYEELLNNYVPVQNVEHANIWQRRPGNWVEPAQDFRPLAVDTAGNSLTIPASTAAGIVVVRVHYQTVNPWKKLPLIGSTPRFIGEIEGPQQQVPISFPPYLESFQFPVKTSASGPITVHFHTDSFLPNASIRVQSAALRTLVPSESTAELFAPRHIPSQY